MYPSLVYIFTTFVTIKTAELCVLLGVSFIFYYICFFFFFRRTQTERTYVT